MRKCDITVSMTITVATIVTINVLVTVDNSRKKFETQIMVFCPFIMQRLAEECMENTLP